MRVATAENLSPVGNLNEQTVERPIPARPHWPTEGAGRGSAYLAHWTGSVAPALPCVETTVQALAPGLGAPGFAAADSTALVGYAEASLRALTTVMARSAPPLGNSGIRG